MEGQQTVPAHGLKVLPVGWAWQALFRLDVVAPAVMIPPRHDSANNEVLASHGCSEVTCQGPMAAYPFVNKSFNAEDAEVIAGDAEVILRPSAGNSAPSTFKLSTNCISMV